MAERAGRSEEQKQQAAADAAAKRKAADEAKAAVARPGGPARFAEAGRRRDTEAGPGDRRRRNWPTRP